MISGEAKMPSSETSSTTRPRMVATRFTRVGFGIAATILVLGEDGHECLREGAFGKQPAQQVGKAEGNEKGVGDEACAERACNHEIAHEAQDPGEQRHAADGCQSAQ